jgi:hypothetical protein
MFAPDHIMRVCCVMKAHMRTRYPQGGMLVVSCMSMFCLLGPTQAARKALAACFIPGYFLCRNGTMFVLEGT